jgi:hypothetical protein
MARKKRRSFTAAQKAAVLKRHHTGKVPVSRICAEEKLQPSCVLWLAEAVQSSCECDLGQVDYSEMRINCHGGSEVEPSPVTRHPSPITHHLP